MLRKTLNFGIPAHVDASKARLIERLLVAVGVIGAIDDTVLIDTSGESPVSPPRGGGR